MDREKINVRFFLGRLIGTTIIDITQDDEDEDDSYIQLMLNNGDYLKFYGAKFEYSIDEEKEDTGNSTST